MARVIRFRVPEGFKADRRWIAPEDYGKLLEFPIRPVRKPGISGNGAGKSGKFMTDIPVLRKMPIL